MSKIRGEWRGHYSYRGVSAPGDGFTASFSESEGRLEGTIIDDNGPGPAEVTGSFSFPSICFTKRYVNIGPVREVEEIGGKKIVSLAIYDAPVEYEGAISADGKMLRGTWIIYDKYVSMGSWEAYRIEEESKSKGQKDEIKQDNLVDQDL